MYKIKIDENGDKVILLEQYNKIISFTTNPNNRFYQEYLEWVAEGNIPEEADV